MAELEKYKEEIRKEAKRALQIFKESYPLFLARQDFPTILAGHMMIWSHDYSKKFSNAERKIFTAATLFIIKELATSYFEDFNISMGELE